MSRGFPWGSVTSAPGVRALRSRPFNILFVLSADYVEQQSTAIEELRAGVNHRMHEVLRGKELKDWTRFGKMRITIEERRRNETTTATTTGDSGTDASGENGPRTQDGPESA